MVEESTTHEDGEKPRIGVYVCHCGLNIAGSVDCEDVARFAESLPHVVLSQDLSLIHI